jgi:hypothetical protein
MVVEWWIVLATVAGPVVAVQTQKWVERASEGRRRRLEIFTALMASRATRISVDFVRALNLIDLVFLPHGFSRAKDKAVINAWRELLGVLNHGPDATAEQAAQLAWQTRTDDKVIELLTAMSTALGFTFTSEELRRGSYHPQGSAEREQAQLAILDGLRKIFSGKATFPMAVKELPVSEELVQAQIELTRKASSAYDAETSALKVKPVTD